MTSKTITGIAACILGAAGFVPDLAAVGRPLVIILAAYYGAKTVIFLAAGAVAMHTDDHKRREACVEIVRIVCRGWPRPGRS
jgi:hypothetical protein